MPIRILGILVLLTVLATANPAQRLDYPNVLDLRNTITDTRDVDRSFFSDKGAWHGYAMPERSDLLLIRDMRCMEGAIFF